mgnify:CR=1 FL=1
MILWNDEIRPKSDVRISPDDRGYIFGDGVYEVLRIYDGRLFEKEAHLTRLARSAAEIRLRLPAGPAEIGERLERLVAASSVSEGILYMQITRGEAPRTHAFPPDAKPVLMAYCNELKRNRAAMQDGIRAVTVPDIRWHRCDIKTLNLLPNVLARQEAAERGASEAILHRDGKVTECSASNIMIVKDGVIRTHPADNYILHGVTRAIALKLAARLEVPVKEQAFTLEEMLAADEVFITGTTVEITPVTEIDGKPVGDPARPVTRRLQEAFARYAGV